MIQFIATVIAVFAASVAIGSWLGHLISLGEAADEYDPWLDETMPDFEEAYRREPWLFVERPQSNVIPLRRRTRPVVVATTEPPKGVA